MVPQAFKNIEKEQWAVFLKKGSYGARFSGLVSKVEKGKVTLTNTKEYTEDKNGNIKREQNKGDVVFDVETLVGSWLIQKGGAKAKTPKERVQQRASGSRAERSKRVLAVDEVDDEDGDEEEQDEEWEDEPEGAEGSIVEEDPLSDEEEEPKKKDKGKVRRKKTLAQEFFQEPNSDEDDPHARREPKRRRKAQGSPEDDDTLANREVVRVNNGLEQYGVSIASVGTHVQLCLRSNVHAKKQLAAALRLLLEVPNNLLRWHFFLRSDYIPSPTNVVSTLRKEAYKYKDYAGLHFLRQLRKMTRTDRTDRTEPFISLRVKTGPDRSVPVFWQIETNRAVRAFRAVRAICCNFFEAEDTSTQGLQLQVASVRGYTKNGNTKVNRMFLVKQRQMEAQLQPKLDAKKKNDEPDDPDDSGPGDGDSGVDAGTGSRVPGTA